MSVPIIKVEIEGIRASMLQYLSAHHDEIERTVSEQMTQVLEMMDLSAIVREAAPQVIKDTVTWMIKDAFDRLRYDEGLKARFAELAREAAMTKYPWEKPRE